MTRSWYDLPRLVVINKKNRKFFLRWPMGGPSTAETAFWTVDLLKARCFVDGVGRDDLDGLQRLGYDVVAVRKEIAREVADRYPPIRGRGR